MVCYAFDDYETWIKPYSLEVYLSQMEKTCEKWKEGSEILKALKGKEAKALAVFSEVAYIHFLSDKLQTEFSYLKTDISKNRDEILKIIDEERKITERALYLVNVPTIAFETSNHYFYNERNLKIKILELDLLEDELRVVASR